MARISPNSITSSSQDWSYDEQSGLPFSGAAVQAWIKEQFDSRAGCFYYDATNNRFLVFSDDAHRDIYLANPTENAALLIGTFDAPFNYSASITLVDTNSVNYIKYGSTGNYINATFDVVNKTGASVGDNMNVTITFKNGSATSTLIRSVAYGTMLTLNVDEYLLAGTNNITITATGQNTLAATSIGLTYYSINLQLSDTFDISQNVSPTGNLNVAFNIIGSGLKHLEWYLDGEKLPYDSLNDDVTANEASRTKTIPLSSHNLTNGRHNFQYRAYIETSDGTLFYSDTLYRDFIVNNGYLQNYLTVVAFTFPYNVNYGTNGIVDPITEPIPIYGAVQYASKDIQYAINSPFGESELQITMDRNTTTHTVYNNTVYNYQLQSFSYGETYLAFNLVTDILEFNVHFEQSQYEDIEEVTNGLVFSLDKSDRTNTSDNRDNWSYGTYSATMNGFSWTDRSGWTENGLLIPDGSSFITNYAPLSGNAVTTGFTFEMEFETERVLDDNAVICDLRNNGTGILITASEASITSRGGANVSTKYKSGVPLRISFVINPPTATRNKNLLFIYIDGILAGAVNYTSTDSFVSSVFLQFAGSQNASILIKQIKCYDRALSANEILNNYTLYRSTTEELVRVHDRNDILDANDQISYEKLAAYTPIIIVTGDVEKLMNFDRSNKGTYVKMNKIEIINNFDPTRNLTIFNASMRCQGTSSMDYPRKNFRFYLAKDSADITVNSYTTQVFDYQGHELLGKERVYSFKENAQPVNCWCLKADYAESSSTHNTGVARLWNTVMKNAVVNNVDSRHYILNTYQNSKTPCKTLAQHAAEQSGYDKDVRTTVDGFPIVLFYHKNESDALICLGKYNWNNDKSTESVYGFKGIPGFDNSNMECWEVVNGDYDINQFVDVSKWSAGKNNGGWQDSFEARYPDDNGDPSEATRAEGALKTVCTWVNSTKGAATIVNNKVVVGNSTLMQKFSTEKWNHLDVYKVAAYYIYLMRFGGVDQTVKNAMFTTEDGQHWYYINYDNDTILGVRNDGLLKFGYDIDRQSKDPDNANAYCYAGHESVLWNNLEADEEFMSIVKVVDQALFNAGLTYTNVINMFNEEQSGKWSERLHNYDYNFKYLDVWLDDQNMQLEKLQGPRRTHREWWLSNRFALYDAKNNTGQYLKSYVSIKPATDGPAPAGDVVKVSPKVNDQVFGWRLGTNGAIYSQSGTIGTNMNFDLHDAGISYYIGGSLFFFNAVYMQKIDFSAITPHITELSFNDVNSDVFDSYLEEIIVGSPTSTVNTAMSAISNLSNVKYLKKLQMCNCTNVSTLNLSSNIYLEDIDMRGSTGLTSVELPVAAPITTIKFPSSLQSLQMKDLVSLTDLSIDSNGASIVNINAQNCKPFTENLNWLKTWITGKTDEYLSQCTVRIEGINWTNVDVSDLLSFGKIGNLTFKGKIQANLSDPENQIPALQAIYGEHCFDSTNELWITGNSVFTTFIGPTTIVEGQTAQYTFVAVGDAGTVRYIINNNNRTGVIINSLTGQLSTTITNEADSTLQVQARFTPSDPTSQNYFVETKIVTILKETYPSENDITISGDTILYDSTNKDYSVSIANTDTYTGMSNLRHSWNLSGDIANYYRIASAPTTEYTCVLACTDNTYVIADGTLKFDLINSLGTIVASKEITLVAQSGNIAIARLTNPEAMTAFWNAFGTNGTKEAGKIANADYVTKFEASAFVSSDFGDGTAAGSIFYKSGMTHFEEIKWFINPQFTVLPEHCFDGLSSLKGVIELPDNITHMYLSSFRNTGFLKIYGNGVKTISSTKSSTALIFKITHEYHFPNCTTCNLGSVTLNSGSILDLPKCTSLTSPVSGITVRLGTLSYSVAGAGLNNNSINLIVSSNCTNPGNDVDIWVDNRNKWNGNHHCPLKSITVDEDAQDKFEVIGGVLYAKDSNGNPVTALRSIYNPGAVTIPETCTSINRRCFSYSNVSSITVPASVTSVGYEAFEHCANLSKLIFLQTTCPSIGSYMLTAATKLKSVGPIGGDYNIEYAWTNAILLGTNASITSLVISETITNLGNGLNGASGLKTITSYAVTAPTLTGFTNMGTLSDRMLYVPTDSTGYDEGNWLDLVINTAGFTLSKTL